MVEIPQDVGKEEKGLLELQAGREESQQQPQQQQELSSRPQPKAELREASQPGRPVVEAEWEVAALLPSAQVGALASGGLPPPQGPSTTVIDLMSDNPPSDKGKEKVDVEMVDATDRPETSATPDDDTTGASTRWPDFVELALVQAEEELPCWGHSPLQFRDATNPDAKPFFTLNDKDEVKFWEYVEGLCKHSVQSLQLIMETLVRHMSGAFEVGYVYLGALFSSTPPFPLGFNFGLDRD
jgi:hypothetical protein